MPNYTHLATGVAAAITAVLMMIGWQHFNPQPTMAKVDIIGIIAAQQKHLEAQMKPGMDEKAQAAVIESASSFGRKLDSALKRVSAECRCTLLNSVAIVKDAPAAIHDYTERLRQLAELEQ